MNKVSEEYLRAEEKILRSPSAVFPDHHFMMVVEGCVRIRTPLKHFILGPNQYIHIPPGTPYAYGTLERSEVYILQIPPEVYKSKLG